MCHTVFFTLVFIMVENYRNRLRTFILMMTSSVMFIHYLYTILYTGEPVLKYIHLPISGLFILGIYLVWKLYDYYKLFDFFMLAYAYTIPMWFAYTQGSFDSHTVFWTFPFLAGFFILIGHRTALIYSVYFVVGQWILYFTDPFDLLFKSKEIETKGFIFSSCCALVLYFAFLQKKIFAKYRKLQNENEKNKALLQVKGGLLHQINNPLSVIESLSKSDQIDGVKLEMLKRNASRVSEVMHELNRIDSISDLEMKKYTGQTQIFHFNYRK